MERITDKHLDGLCNRLNRITGSPQTYMETSTNPDGTTSRKILVGHYHIDKAYGGCQLVRTCNDGGGITTPLYMGHVSKRQCYELIYAYIRGIEDQQQSDLSGNA